MLQSLVAEIPEQDLDLRQFALGKTGGFTDHRHRGLKHHGLTAHLLQLLHCIGMVARFAQGFAVQISHLV